MITPRTWNACPLCARAFPGSARPRRPLRASPAEVQHWLVAHNANWVTSPAPRPDSTNAKSRLGGAHRTGKKSMARRIGMREYCAFTRAATIAALDRSMLRTLARRFVGEWAPRTILRRGERLERRDQYNPEAATTRTRAPRRPTLALHQCRWGSARSGRDRESPVGEVDRRAREYLFR